MVKEGEERIHECVYTCTQLNGLLLISPDEFAHYCSDIENTAAWGGQLEVSVIYSLCVLYTCTLCSELFVFSFSFLVRFERCHMYIR